VKVLTGLNPLLIFCDEPCEPNSKRALVHCGRKVGSTVLDPHAAVASRRLCPWRSLFQFPLRSSVALFGLGGEPRETGFIYGLQRLIISEIYSVVCVVA
jgi:hypothetical protein